MRPVTIAPMQAPPETAASALAPALQSWIDILQAARLESRPVRLVGGGSKAFLCLPPAPNALALHTGAHRGIVAYEPSELVLTARAGTPLAEIEALLATQGQCLAFEPPHFGPGATLGGAVAAGLSGPARASAGALRDFVLGVHVLNGRGQYLEFGGQVMKNVAGYDLSRLLAGSWGSLGVLAQVSLKVLPLAPAEATLRFELTQAAALEQLARWRALPLPLNASCWVRDLSAAHAPEHLYVRLRGAAAAVAAARGEQLDPAACATDWQACREQTLPFFTHPPAPDAALWRLSVAPTSATLDAPWPTLIEWHGGLRWVWAPQSEAATLRAWAQAQGGHATLWRSPQSAPAADGDPHAAAAALAALRFTPPASALQAIHQRLKAEFDPHGLLSPGQWGWGL